MRLNRKLIVLFGILSIVCIAATYIYVIPIATKVRADLETYETLNAIRDDYTLHTTPLPTDVVADLCLKLGLAQASEHCQPNVVVYAPELFDEIKTYFMNLPDQEKTYNVVQSRLGEYLDYCGKANPDGSYTCKYDLRGDKVYPIAFFFDKNGKIYRIIANWRGS